MNKQHYIFFLAGLFFFGAVSCTKVTDAPIRTSHPMTDAAGDLVRALDSSNCHLFDMAFHRAGMDTVLSALSGYTILAPSDSAMTAAGLTAQVIGTLSTDSVARLVRYHITAGFYNDTTLAAAQANIQVATLRQDIFTDTVKGDVVYQQEVYLREYDNALYINGEFAQANAHPVSAFNGYLFTIGRVLRAPGQTLWEIIATDPRLSLYRAALRIDDSLALTYEINYYQYRPQSLCSDSILFSTILYSSQANSNLNQPTVFAPTDSAFIAAGFKTVDDIRRYALSAPLADEGISANNQYFVLADVPMDSILYAHILFSNTDDNPMGYLLLYNDLQSSPLVNHGLVNANDYQIMRFVNSSLYYFQPYPLFFSVQNNVPYIQWNPALPPAPVPPDTDPSHPRHYLAMNGALYIIDQLFTSPN